MTRLAIQTEIPSAGRTVVRRPDPAAQRATPHAPAAGGRPLAATDPRWVLALRVRETLEGRMLRPDARQRLIRLGRLLGMTGFEANLVIAIVQDGARRGQGLGEAAGSLACVPRHRGGSTAGRGGGRGVSWWPVVRWVAILLAAEAAVVAMIVG